MQKLKIAYFGSPSFSGTFLEKIINDKNLPVEVKLVVTQPDMPVGRKQILTPTPVKLIAEKYQLPIIYSTEFKISNDQLSITNDQSIINDPMINNKSTEIEKLRIEYLLNIEQLNIDHLDLCLVYAYGEILPKEILSLPKFGFWNIHPSLLPLYRGASPIAYPLILGDKKTGVSLILMDEKMDHGPIIAQEEIEIKSTDTRPDLENKLTDLAFLMFKKLMTTVQKKAQTPVSNDLGGAQSRTSGTSTPTGVRNTVLSFIKVTPQDHSKATYAPYLKKSDGFVPFPILKKMLQNENITIKELPQFIQEYINKFSNNQLSMINQCPIINDQLQPIENWKLLALSLVEGKIGNSSKLLFNLFRGLSPWPGLWTTVDLRGRQLRLKIIRLTMKQFNNLTIDLVQLENKNPVDFKTFNIAYQLFTT